MSDDSASLEVGAPASVPSETAAIHRRGKVRSSVASMFGSDIVAKFLLLGFFFGVAKIVPEEEMDIFVFCNATVAILAILIGFGLRQVLIREIASHRDNCRRFVETVLWQRMMGMIAGLVLLFALTFVVPPFAGVRLELMLAALAICMLMLSDSGTAVFEGLEHMHWVPVIQSIDGLTRLACLVFLFFLPPKAWVVILLVVVAQTATAIVSLTLTSRLLNGIPIPRRHKNTLGYALRQGLPLMFLGFAQRTTARFDWVLLYLMNIGPGVTAAYGVGYRIYEGLNMMAPALLRGTFPRLTQSTSADPNIFIGRVGVLAKALLLLNLLVASTALFHIDQILSYFGDSYRDANVPAMILLCGLPALGLFGSLYYAFLAKKLLKIMLLNGVLVAGLNVLFNLFAIPMFGSIGAACSTVVPYMIVIGLACHWFRRYIGPLPFDKSMLLCLIPAAPTLAVGYFLPAPWMVIALVQVACFMSVAWLANPFTAEQRALLKRALRGRA